MTMTRILQCVLAVFVLSMAGCGLLGITPDTEKTSNPSTTTNNRKKIDFSKAEGKVRDAIKKMRPSTGTADSTIKLVKADVSAAQEQLKLDNELADACACTDAINEANSASQLLNTFTTKAGSDSKKVSELDEELSKELQTYLETAAGKLQTATKLAGETKSGATVTNSPSSPKSMIDDPTWGWIIFIAKVASGLFILSLLAYGLFYFRDQSWRHLEHQLAKATADQISATRDAQKEVLDKLSSLSSAQKDTGTRLHDMHTEIRSLARLVRESAHSRGDGHSSYSSLASSFAQSEPLPPDEPDFPVSVFDYLGKMTRFTNVVKRDFQNNILISDPDGTGELVLIRDSRVPDETQPLFVVPRHGQFQTKQDFHTYYEKYYDCHRPQAGDVWIIDPAVVEKVSGGWQLREKGLLEIRS